ncbi:DUF397 domain-containing protein [Fodinicola feengrottensis]|uniref:DUF397 domain-containing protein n=1 Tax=Fodinicola feengrottensis TaxID=435914 RepID=A0ABN2IJW8_9ACTN
MTEAEPQPEIKIQPDLTNAVWQSAEGDDADPDQSRVEIAFVEDKICMRNGAEPDGPVLTFTQAEWDAFVLGAKDGEFDLDEDGNLPPLPPQKSADPAS